MCRTKERQDVEEYKIVYGTPNHVEETVLKLLSEGYQLQGGITKTDSGFAQAMYKPKRPPAKKKSSRKKTTTKASL